MNDIVTKREFIVNGKYYIYVFLIKIHKSRYNILYTCQDYIQILPYSKRMNPFLQIHPDVKKALYL